MQNKQKIPFLTDSVKRLTALNILIFVLLLIFFNALLISFIYYIAHRNMDQRITHEIEKVTNTLSLSGNVITVTDSSELKESDFYELTESPYFLQVLGNDGKIILTSRNVTLFKRLPFKRMELTNDLFFESFDFENITFRSGYKTLYDSSGKEAGVLQISVYERNFKNFMKDLLYFNLWAVLGLLFIVILASIWAAKKTFKPINQIIEASLSFNIQNFNKRIEVNAKPNDEIGRLRDTLNGLFNRIEDYVLELTHFSDHVSHQLMNPLTAIQTEIEYLLKKERTSIEYNEALVKLSAQTDNMISIVKTLLLIAKSGKVKTKSTAVFNLSKLINNEVEFSFRDYNISYSIEDNLYLRGESEKFLMVIQNLIHNAIKYSPQDKNISVRASKIDSKIIVSVEDNGIGIEDAEKELIFKKFFRSDRAEKLGIKGFGLGLSLVKSLVEEIRGTIEVKDNKPTGSIFLITLPAIDLSD